ncbi:MAG: hypothetical protein ACLT0Y_03175 [Christensenellales bacterium]
MMLVLLSTLLICVIETNNPQVTLETALYECISRWPRWASVAG